MAANTFIPESATTMPSGMPMEIPIYYRSFWGTANKIIPDSLFVNGPAVVEFDTAAFSEEFNGWLNNYSEYAAGENRSGAEIIDLVARNYSISPRVLLALSEIPCGGINQKRASRQCADLPARVPQPAISGVLPPNAVVC